MYMLMKYERVVNIFNETISKIRFWAFSWMSHYFWTWSGAILHLCHLKTSLKKPTQTGLSLYVYAFIFHVFLSDILSNASHVLFLEISNLRKPEINSIFKCFL